MQAIKRLLLFAGLITIFATVALAQSEKQVNVVDLRSEILNGSWAIVVGINDYSDSEIEDLIYCENDARAFEDALTESGGFPKDRVKLFTGANADQTSIYAALKSIADAKSLPERSTIVFYFSGHGFAYGGSNYIIPQDGTVFPDLIDSRNLKLERIEEMLAESSFERQLIFIDACRNQVTTGGKDIGTKGFAETVLTVNAKGMKVFLGTEFGQVSRESEEMKSGIFTHFLIDGISGAADLDNNGVIQFYELSGYVSTKMEERNIGARYPQRPVTRGEGSDLIPVAALPGGITEVDAGAAGAGGTVETIAGTGFGAAPSGFGTLRLTLGVDGVDCFIDGILKGTSSDGGIVIGDISPGEHTVKLTKQGYDSREFRVTVYAGQMIEKSLNFSAVSGIIRITSNIAKFHVYMDGEYVKLVEGSSFDVVDVAYGEHTLIIKKAGYADQTYKVTIRTSAATPVSVTLTRVFGQLTVKTTPGGASVKITSSDAIVVSAGFAGKSFNCGAEASTSKPLSLTPGKYTVTISLAGYETVTKSVEITKNIQSLLDIELKKAETPTVPPALVPTTVDWSKGARKYMTLSEHSSWVSSASFSPDGRFIVTGSFDNTAKIWNMPDGALIKTLTGHSYKVYSASYSPDGRYIVTGSSDKTTAKVWDAASGNLIRTLRHSYAVNSASFSPDGRFIVTGCDDNTAKVWDAASGKLLHTLSAHSSNVWSASFSPDGRFIVTGSDDNTAKVWDAASGKLIHTLSGHSDWVSSASFSPDGRYIVTGSGDKTAKVWHAESGKLIHTLSGHGNRICSVSFSPDGKYIATGSGDDTCIIWEPAA